MNTNLVHGIHGKFKQLQLLAWPMQESSKRKHKRVIWHGLKQKKQQLRPQWHHRGKS